MAITAADRYFLPTGASSIDYLVVPTTLMRDEEDLQLVATAEPTAIEELEEDLEDKVSIIPTDGHINISDTHGQWVYIYDMYGNLWFRRPAVTCSVSLPGPRIYIVQVGKNISKVLVD